MTRTFAISCALFSVVLSCLMQPAPGWSQSVVLPPSALQVNYGAYYSPATAAALQIHAEAEFMRGYGAMQKDLAEASVRYAEAYKLQGENRVADRVNRIKIWELEQQDRSNRIMARINQRQENNDKTWERLKHHPALTHGEIRSGKALNFLKDRLSTSEVTYQSTGDVTELRLSPDQVHRLQVRQALDRGEALVFRLDEGQPIQVDWWPPALRVAELKTVRSRFEQARNDVFKTQAPEDFEKGIKNLQVAHANFEEEFLSHQPHAKRVKTQQSIHDYFDGRNVLKSLATEIRRLQRVGPGQSSIRDLSFKGTQLPELLSHMIRNGLEFAAPRPGDEQVYEQTFEKLRKLYLAVEDSENDAEAAKKN